MKSSWIAIALLVCAVAAQGSELFCDPMSLTQLSDHNTKMVNSLWTENPEPLVFSGSRREVTIADLKGPGLITMIHFAIAQNKQIGREVQLRIYWDGEKSPSVQVPLVDFFCDPDGKLERVDSALVNKKRGWNCYWPMPFAKSARVVISNTDRRGGSSRQVNPCYAYVMYRTLDKMPPKTGYFHSTWNTETLLLGKKEYPVFTAKGQGNFVGWNVALRGATKDLDAVDENVKFYVDGEKEPSIEWQGIEDSFGFSWGFPGEGNSFPYTGYQPWKNGHSAYRLCLNDRITFTKSVRMQVGFGKKDDGWFYHIFSQPGNELEFSSTAYWYQAEPHEPFAPLQGPPPPPIDPSLKPSVSGETLSLNCGSGKHEIQYIKPGWEYWLENGTPFGGWPTEVNYCWNAGETLKIRLYCPKQTAGTLRMYLLDGDNLGGGRKERVTVAGHDLGVFDKFQKGQWVETPISAQDTAKGEISIIVQKLNGNAVVSKIQFLEKQ